MTTAVALRPFVHLFRTDGARYAYDVNSGKVVEIDELNGMVLANWDKADDEVAQAAEGRFSAEDVARVRSRIAELSGSGELFSVKRPVAVRSPHTRKSAECKLTSECHQLILCAAEACNMRCKYCYYTSGRDSERSHGTRLMTWETAKKALDFYLPRSRGTMTKYKAQMVEIKAGKKFRSAELIPKPCVGFYGGEPLTNWPLMKRVIEYVRGVEDGEEYLVNCTINGTLLTPDIMRFMAAHNVTLSISLDGPREYHDRYRRFADGRPTWDVVVGNLIFMRENMREYYDEHVNLLGVMAPPNDMRWLLDFVLNTDFLPRRGIRFNGVEPDSPPCFWSCLAPEEKEIAGEDELWRDYVEAAVQGKLNFDGMPADEKERKRIGFLRGLYNLFVSHAYCRTRFLFEGKNLVPDVIPNNFGMCLPGQERIFVTVDGRILPCERMPSEAPDLQIGDVDKGFDMDRIMHIAEGNAALVEDRCVNCWNVRMCSIPCHKILGPDGHLSRDAKLAACEASRRKSHNSLQAMSAILERNPKALEFMDLM